jgi:hypothetical protein
MHRNMQAMFCDGAVAEFTVMQQNWQKSSKSSQLDDSVTNPAVVATKLQFER